MFPPPADQPEKSRPLRVVPAAQPWEAPPPPIEDLRRGAIARLLATLPPWGQVIVLTVFAGGLGGGVGIAAIAKWAGLETAASATDRENRIILRVVGVEGKLVEADQKRRKEGLSKRAQADVAKIVEEQLAAQAPVRPKRKAATVKAKHEPEPAPDEASVDERP